MAYMTAVVRTASSADLDAILAIEDGSFVEPWSRALFVEEFAQPTRRYLVAEDGGRVCGYGGIMLVGDDAHLVTLAVDPAMRRQGIAARLMMELVAAARAGGAHHLTLEVRQSNAAARALYAKFGFEPAGTRKGYYTTEDAVVMWAIDIDSVDYEATLASIRRAAS